MGLSSVCPSCRPSIIVDPGPIIQPDTPTYMVGPEGSHFVSAYAYPEYFTLEQEEEVNTYQIDFYAGGVLGIDLIRGIIENVLPIFRDNFETIVAYSLFENIVFDLQVPDQVCIGDWCFTPPFAGGSVITGYHYRLWILSRNSFPPPPPLAQTRGFILTPALIIAMTVAIIAVAPVVIGGILILQGKIKFKDLVQSLQETLTLPGENAKRATSEIKWIALAFGAGMIIVAALLPIAMTKLSVSAPIGPVRVGATQEFATAGPPPRRRR